MNTEQQYLTEKEAWLKLAEVFKQQRDPHDNNFTIFRDDPNNYETFKGICVGIYSLKHLEFIQGQTEEIMIDKMEDFGDKLVNRFGMYFWPLTPEGDKQRVQFCIDRANEL